MGAGLVRRLDVVVLVMCRAEGGAEMGPGRVAGRGPAPHEGRGGPDQGVEVAMKKQDRFG